MPITFKIADGVKPEDVFKPPYPNQAQPPGKRSVTKPEDVLAHVLNSDSYSCKELLQTSLKPSSDFIANEAGFVHTVVRAYNQHHNLIIRPDDLWCSILSQLNLYINAHAEELRSKFVAHEGQAHIKIITAGTRYTVDYGKLAEAFGDILRENIVDPTLHDWILPNFSTSTHNDMVIASVMMMSTLKAYFTYEISLRCGIPSITLLGEKHDYESILARLQKLEEFGEEPKAFARLLNPILQQFVLSFDTVAKGETPDYSFWGRMCHYHPGGSGPTYIGGWIATFASWNKDGGWQGPKLNTIDQPLSDEEKNPSRWGPPPPLIMSGLRYPLIDTNKVPRSFCDVDVMLDDNGELFDCKMVAGHVGSVASGEEEEMFDTLQPASEWFMFIADKAPEARPPPTRTIVRWR